MRGIIEAVEGVMAAKPINGADNRIRYTIAVACMPTEADKQKFNNYLLGILFNYVPEDVLAYAIGQAFRCWWELNPEVSHVSTR